MTPQEHRRPRVLVADDHPDILQAICRLLAPDCDVVGTVSDGCAVLEAVKRLQPDVTVVDLNLGTVSGFEACRQIRALNPVAKVVVFTAMNDPCLRDRAFDLGASAFLCKVATDADLVDAVQCLYEQDE